MTSVAAGDLVRGFFFPDGSRSTDIHGQPEITSGHNGQEPQPGVTHASRTLGRTDPAPDVCTIRSGIAHGKGLPRRRPYDE